MRARAFLRRLPGLPAWGALGLGLLPLLPALLSAGCARSSGAGPQPPTELVVFAASSLREAFGRLEEAFERAHPGVEVHCAFAGSQELRTQLEQGARADVFASADAQQLQALSSVHALEPQVFARNEPVLILSSEAAARVHSLEELPRVKSLVLGAPEVPIGRYTDELLDRAQAGLGGDFRAQVEAKVVSRELNVRQVLGKVSLGEAEAGIVYRTDALSAGSQVRAIPLPSELARRADYPIAVLEGAAQPELARAWVAFVLSAEGQQLLAASGFVPAGAQP